MRFLKIFFGLIFVAILATPVAIFGYYYTQEDYELSNIIEYKPKLTTRIYDRHGERIANIFDGEHRLYASINEIPPRVIEALLAIEDTTFFEHPGINIDAILRAIIKDIQSLKLAEGASTITQQLVKNTLLTREKKISRKIKEVIYSLKLERQLTKEQIVERYLNEIYYGHGYYGIKTAALGYFKKPLGDLSLKESAMLVGLPKAPSTYAPTKNYQISLGRANRVVARMYELGWIDEDSYKEALQEEPTVYDETLTQNLSPFVVDEIFRSEHLYGIGDLRGGGYEIYTTIDMQLQRAAELSLAEAYELALGRGEEMSSRASSAGKKRIAERAEVLNGAMVSLDHSSGEILALVGSVDYKKSAFNRASQGSRLLGSAFKPFIYQVALDMGYSGASLLADISRTYSYSTGGERKKWQPKNYEKNFEGMVSLRDSLVHSRNLATINLVEDIGLTTLTKELKRFAFSDIPQNLSLSLGTISTSPLKLARSFSSFANGGVQVEPVLVKKIEKNSSVIYEAQPEKREVTSPQQAYLMTSILQDVVSRGTGRSAAVRGIEIAGKTGTTNNNIDGWFIGYSPTIETVVWFGNDDNTPMNALETGGRVSGPAFANYYARILEIYPQTPRKFIKPDGISQAVVNGKREFFSNISKPPRIEESSSVDDDGMIF